MDSPGHQRMEEQPAQGMLEHALNYLDDEWSVFPVCTPVIGRPDRCRQHGACSNPGKTPLVRWAVYQDRLPTRQEVASWWSRTDWRQANIGLATGQLSNVVVLDLDGDLARAEAQRRGYDDGPTVRTGRVGGQHLYFRYRDDAPTIFAKTGGIDFRGEGGFVLLPPSLHHSGARYAWVEPIRRGEPLPDLPRWVDAEARTRLDGAPRGNVKFAELVSGVPQGQRDQELFRAAAKLRGVDLPYDVALEVIGHIAARCQPPFEPALAQAKVDSAYGRYQPNVSLAATVADDEIDAATLLQVELPEPRWAVPGLFPEGVVLLVGKSKLGKSWFALDVALSVVEGGFAWGTIAVEAGEVLYLALEDSRRRLQDRLRTLRSGNLPPPGLTLRTQAPRSNEGGIPLVLDWLDRHPRARLVIIDVLGKFRPHEASLRRLYDLDYEAITPIGEVARARGVCVLVLHHANKLNPEDPLDSVSGTTGLVGAADAVCILRRERGQADASLFVVGRDVEEQDLAFKNTLGEETGYAWRLLGNAEDFRRSKERQEIIDLLTVMPGLKPGEIADALDKKPGNVRRLLFSMVRSGEVRLRDGRYFVGLIYRSNDNERPPSPISAQSQDAALPRVTSAPVPVTSSITRITTDTNNPGVSGSTATRPVSDTRDTADTDVCPVTDDTGHVQKEPWWTV